MLYAFIGLALACTIGSLVYYLRHDNVAKGKAEEAKEIMGNMLDEVRRVQDARNSLNSDPAAAKRLREKYTRRT